MFYYDLVSLLLRPATKPPSPASGQEIVCEMSRSTALRKWDCSFRFKHEAKPEKPVRQENPFSPSSNVQRTGIQTSILPTNTYLRAIELPYPYQITLVTGKKREKHEGGCLILSRHYVLIPSQTSHQKPNSAFAYFDTDSYNTRIYAYEHNVSLRLLLSRLVQNRGLRSYLNLNWKALQSHHPLSESRSGLLPRQSNTSAPRLPRSTTTNYSTSLPNPHKTLEGQKPC